MSTALITGANRGIGQELARELAVDGWDVLVGARDRKKADAAAARLRKDTGGRLKGVELDVTADASAATCAQKLRDGAIRLDALVNNAGILRGDDAAIFDTNFFGPLRVTLALLPLLRDGASITNVTSGLGALAHLDDAPRRALADPALTRAALVAFARGAVERGDTWGTDAYGASKAALNALTRVLAAELAPRGIRVNAVDPGWVRSDMGGRNAPRSLEQGAAGIRAALTTGETGAVLHDGRRVSP